MKTYLKSRRKHGKYFTIIGVYWWHHYSHDKPSEFIGEENDLPQYALNELNKSRNDQEKTQIKNP